MPLKRDTIIYYYIIRDEMKKDIIIETVLESGVKTPGNQIELFAKRLLPEIKQFMADKNIQKKFEKWLRNKIN